MKMSEVFNLPIEYQGSHFGEQDGSPVGDTSNYDKDSAAAHAINCHDEPVEALRRIVNESSGHTVLEEYELITARDKG